MKIRSRLYIEDIPNNIVKNFVFYFIITYNLYILVKYKNKIRSFHSFDPEFLLTKNKQGNRCFLNK